MSPGARLLAAVACAIGVLSLPARVEAQWYAGTYLGANHNAPASVSIDQPALTTSLVFHDVSFASQPFHFPLYWGARVGRIMGRHWGLEFELLHLKVIARTDQSVHVTGAIGGSPIDATQPMDLIVQRYNMTHGLNFLLANVVVRAPLAAQVRGRPVSLTARVGGGPTIAGTDTLVELVHVGRYERAGAGGQASVALDVPIAGGWSGVVEYKLTYARPTISILDGRGQTSVLTSQVAFGLSLGFSRHNP